MAPAHWRGAACSEARVGGRTWRNVSVPMSGGWVRFYLYMEDLRRKGESGTNNILRMFQY